jgi:hypothetical protein
MRGLFAWLTSGVLALAVVAACTIVASDTPCDSDDECGRDEVRRHVGEFLRVGEFSLRSGVRAEALRQFGLVFG